MFAADEIDEWAAKTGIGPDPAGLYDDWSAALSAALDEATLTHPDEEWMATGGKQGTHSEHLGYLLADMQFLQRAYPGATW
jgi:ring-1,2-phenylacetyl-CoA epoxidase subunit PaaC